MRTLTILLAGLLTLAVLMAPASAAQDTDIPKLAEMLDSLSPGEIQAALNTPIPDDILPSVFSDATLIDQDEATMEATEAGAAKSSSFSLTYTPGDSATPSAEASPHAGGPGRVYNTGSVTYLIFDEALTPEALAGFDEILRASIGAQAADADVQDITVADQPAFLVTIETETNGIPLIMDWVAVPVGKVVVISMTMSGGDSVDREALVNDAEALSQGAISHLQTAIEQRGTPAG